MAVGDGAVWREMKGQMLAVLMVVLMMSCLSLQVKVWVTSHCRLGSCSRTVHQIVGASSSRAALGSVRESLALASAAKGQEDAPKEENKVASVLDQGQHVPLVLKPLLFRTFSFDFYCILVASKGLAGVLAIAVAEAIFWALGMPLATIWVKLTTGEWIDLTTPEVKVTFFNR